MIKEKVQKIIQEVSRTETEADILNKEADDAKTYFGGKIRAARFFISEHRPRLFSRRSIRFAGDQIVSEARVHFEERVRVIENSYEASKKEIAEFTDYGEETLVEEAFYESDDTFLARAVKESMESTGLNKMRNGKKKKEVEVALRRTFGGMTGLGLGFGAVEFGDEQIIAIQKSCRLRYKLDGHFSAIVDNFKSYILGRGVTFKFPVPEIQEVVKKKYWDFNDMDNEQNNYLTDLLVDGERFSRYKKVEDKNNFVALKIDATEIAGVVMVENKFSAYFLRKFMKNEKLEEIWYQSVFFNKLEERELEPEETIETTDSGDQEIYHMKFGGESRGFPPFARILRVLRFLETFINDVRRLYHEQSRVILIKYQPKNFRGFDKPLSETVKGGVVLKGIKDVVDYEFKSPNLDAGPVDTIGRLFRLTIAAGSRMPEFIAFMDGNTAVYASVKKMENPFSNAVLDYQDAFKTFLETEIRIFIDWAIESDLLQEEYKIKVFDEEAIEQAFNIIVSAITSGDTNQVKESSQAVVDALKGKSKEITVITREVKIDWIFPDMVSDEPLKIAARMKILLEKGIISKETAATQAGLDWKVEVSRMAREAILAGDNDKEDPEDPEKPDESKGKN